MTWDDVVATALVGTDRRPGEDATALLDVAAVFAVARRAGAPPVPDLPSPPGVPADPVPPAGPAAAERLSLLLDNGLTFDPGTRAELVGEWLASAVERGIRVPGEQLPVLFEAARRERELRDLVLAAGGARAGWLAAQRADWRFLTGRPADAASPDAWELGGIGQRVRYLVAARQADPAAARDLLVIGWADEIPEDRAALLRALRPGLSTADEEFLEACLDDRRKEVRDVALDLLAVLPGSAYLARMTERAERCLWRPGQHRVLAVAPPEECDRAMRRDGIAPKAPAGVGEKAWWLEEILARTPLSTWGDDPAGFLALPVADGWGDVVLRGLARAAATQDDPAWAGPLIDALWAAHGPQGRPDDMLLIESLYAALPVDEVVDRAVQALRPGGQLPGVDHLLELTPRPWPPRLADAVFAALDQLVSRPVPSWRTAELCQLAAVRLPVDAAPRADAFAAAHAGLAPNHPVRRAADTLAGTLRFRHDMLEELT